MFLGRPGHGRLSQRRAHPCEHGRDPVRCRGGHGFPYAIAERLDDVLARLALVLPKAQGVRRLGAASVDLAYVAAGRQDAFYEMLLKPWDVAAGWLLVEEAGGRVTTLDGRPYSFGDEIMASNGLVHKELRHLLAGVTPVQAERRPA